MLRKALVLTLCVSSSSFAFGQGGQSDDDEKPGSRQKARGRSTPDEARDSDTPPASGNSQPSAAPADDGQPGVDAPADGAPNDTPSGKPLRMKGKVHPEATHGEGKYAGVSLGGEGLPPKAPKLPLHTGPNRMTWPGFQVRDGVPTVFLQTTSAPNYTVTERVGAVIVTLHGTTIKLRNNERPLKVAEFGTDVTEVAAKPHGKDVIVTITRKGEGHRERVEPSAGGFQVLVVELPKKD